MIGDKISIKGLVTIYQEDDKGNREYLCKGIPNHWVDAGLKGLLSALMGNAIVASAGGNRQAWAYAVRIYIGTDTVTPTTHNSVSLSTPIGASPGTEPNTVYGENRTNPSSGVWHTAIVCTWAPGTVAGTVGEVALYMGAFTSITPYWTATNVNFANVMVSRLSEADGDFTHAIIDVSKTFTVYWEVQVTFT